MSESLVAVSSYWYAVDADLAKNTLEAAGIEAFVDDQNMVRLNWLNANAVHGVKVRVRAEDALRAGEVLNERCELLGEIEEEIKEPVVDPTICPVCDAPGATRRTRGIQIGAISVIVAGVGLAIGRTQEAFLLILIMLLFALMDDRWRCGNCGESWN
jgi:hypothetical protein